jgi:hypothetical protein
MPFVKGQSGNPGGRSKALAEWRKSDDAQRLRDISYKALENAVLATDIEWKDRIHAAGMLLDRVEGKCVQTITGDDGGPIKFEVSDGMQALLNTMAD